MATAASHWLDMKVGMLYQRKQTSLHTGHILRDTDDLLCNTFRFAEKQIPKELGFSYYSGTFSSSFDERFD